MDDKEYYNLFLEIRQLIIDYVGYSDVLDDCVQRIVEKLKMSPEDEAERSHIFVLDEVRAIAYKHLAPNGFYKADTAKKEFEDIADKLFLFKQEIDDMITEICEHFV